MLDLDTLRNEFAQQWRAEVHLHSGALVQALANVPRERLVGPGPWQIIDLKSGKLAYQQPSHLEDERCWVHCAYYCLAPRKPQANGRQN